MNGFQTKIQAKMIKYFTQEKILIENLKFCKKKKMKWNENEGQPNY